jgi:hypothetical protein
MATDATPAENVPDEKVTGKRIDKDFRQEDRPEMEAPPVREVEVVEDAGVSKEPMPTPEDAQPAENTERVTLVDGNDGVTRKFPQE